MRFSSSPACLGNIAHLSSAYRRDVGEQSNRHYLYRTTRIENHRTRVKERRIAPVGAGGAL
jgi:hypothetical protein